LLVQSAAVSSGGRDYYHQAGIRARAESGFSKTPGMPMSQDLPVFPIAGPLLENRFRVSLHASGRVMLNVLHRNGQPVGALVI